MRKRNYLTGVLIGSALIGLNVLTPAALANITGITIQAEVEPYVILQLETINDEIVSPDDMHLPPDVDEADVPDTNEILDFGTVDPAGSSPGDLEATNGPISGVLERRLLVSGVFEDPETFNGTMTDSDGAVYFINDGYQLRGLRNDGQNSMEVDVEVTGGTALDAVVDLANLNDFTVGDPIAPNTIRIAGGGQTDLVDNMALDTPYMVDLGIVVRRSTEAGPTETVIVFTGV